MNRSDLASVEGDDEPLGQDHAVVVVAEHRMYGRELLQRREDRCIGDVAARG